MRPVNLLFLVNDMFYTAAIHNDGIIFSFGVQPALPDRKSVDIYEGEIHKKYNDRRRMKKE